MGANNKETYHRRKKEGVCPNCASHKVMKGKTYCRDCVEMISIINRERMNRLKVSGMCRMCGEHLTDYDRLKNGKMATACKSCRDLSRKYKKVYTKNE